jgi:hypothetical protein
MRQIAIALHNYHDQNGRLPPAQVRAPDGSALYSWRVLILPYLEAEDLYKQFHLDEPWDSPHNKALIPRMPKEFAPLGVDDVKAEPFTTFYQVFVGPGTAFEGGQGLRLPDDFPAGTATTLLVVEAREAVPWTKPVDLAYEPGRPVPSLGGVFKSEGRFSLFGPNRVVGFHAALADGSVRFLSAHLREAVLRGMITRSGAEELRPEW